MRAYRGHGAPTRDDLNVLDCIFCGSYFPTFDMLAAHVKRIHPDGQSAPARRQARKDRYAMAKKTTRGRAPAKSKKQATATPPPFLTADDITGRERFQIQQSVSLYQRNDGGTSLFIVVMNEKKKLFTLSLRCAGPDRISLQDQCGRNLLDWPNKVIVLYVQETDRGGRFVNIYDEARESRRSQARTQRQARDGDDEAPF